ncbi:bifunctional nuclease family protein [bacterium]|nr:MAG: bifunctional nuclease family protein [bacterium]
MRLLKIDSLAIDAVTNDMVVILRVEEDNELLPIWIGNAEALSIALALAGRKPPRPMTHDLIANILTGLETKHLRVVISALVDNTYYALLYMQRGDELIVIDARPSDSIALATRTGASIFLEDDVPTISGDENDESYKNLETRLRRVNPEQILGE